MCSRSKLPVVQLLQSWMHRSVVMRGFESLAHWTAVASEAINFYGPELLQTSLNASCLLHAGFRDESVRVCQHGGSVGVDPRRVSTLGLEEAA